MKAKREKERWPGAAAPLRIPPELEASWVRNLRDFYDMYNDQYARRRLRPPLIRIGFAEGRLGGWDPRTRTITISARHILAHPWERILDTLRHEMAHQYVHEVLGLGGDRPHGEAFARACKLLRCRPRARSTGDELGDLAASRVVRDRILTRVKELLALAGSPNEHEAANAMRLAHRYLLKYNLSLADVGMRRHYETRYLGRASARIQEYQHILALLLQDHFFVLVIWTYSYDPLADRHGRVLQICGTPENLQVAEYVHTYVMRVAMDLWKAHKKAHPRGGGTKLQYLAGLLSGLREKLDRQKRRLKEERGLVWRGDAGLADYFRYVNPRIRRFTTTGVSRNERYLAGQRDGHDIEIRRPLAGEEGPRRRGRALPRPGGP